MVPTTPTPSTMNASTLRVLLGSAVIAVLPYDVNGLVDAFQDTSVAERVSQIILKFSSNFTKNICHLKAFCFEDIGI